MKIIIAPDKFKGSLNGEEFSKIVKKQILDFDQKIEIISIPLADGGDGTLQILSKIWNVKKRRVKVTGPLFYPTKATYLLGKEKAFIEMAEASGMRLIKKDELNCKKTTSLGTGQLIMDAIENGAKTIYLGLGGSATNDGGIGILQAFGYKFFDEKKNELEPIGENLSKIVSLSQEHVNPKVFSIQFIILSDVKNEMYGPNGAAFSYAKQKGATDEEIIELDKGLKNWANIIEDKYKINPQHIEGSGAAGGIIAGLCVLKKIKIEKGAKYIMKLAKWDKQIQKADWIITGEGKFDKTSFQGKVIGEILKSIENTTTKLAVFTGHSEIEYSNLNKKNLKYLGCLSSLAPSLNESINNPHTYLSKLIGDFIAKHL